MELPPSDWEKDLPLIWEALHDARNLLYGLSLEGLVAEQDETPRRLHDIRVFAGEIASQASTLLSQVAPGVKFKEVGLNFGDLPHSELGQSLLPPGSFPRGADPTDPRSIHLKLIEDRLIAGRDGEYRFSGFGIDDQMLIVLNSVLACRDQMPKTAAFTAVFGWSPLKSARVLASVLERVTGGPVLKVVNFGRYWRVMVSQDLSVIERRPTAPPEPAPPAAAEEDGDSLSTGIPIDHEKRKAMGVDGFLTDGEIMVLARGSLPTVTLESVQELLRRLNFERGTFLPPRTILRTVRRYGREKTTALPHYSPETAAWVWRQLAKLAAEPSN
jgi:hypothetical protein